MHDRLRGGGRGCRRYLCGLGVGTGFFFGGTLILRRVVPLIVGAEHPHGDKLACHRSDRVIECVEPVSAEVIAVVLGLSAYTESSGAEAERFEFIEPSACNARVLIADMRKDIFQDLGRVVRHGVTAFNMQSSGGELRVCF